MRKIVEYECEICKSRYDSEKNARDCEDTGLAPEYPVGCIYQQSFYKNMIFAVAENYLDRHYNYFSSWACRDIEIGDSLGKNMCGGNRSCKLNEHMAIQEEHRELPVFQRMVNFLKSEGIRVTIWNGTKPVPYENE